MGDYVGYVLIGLVLLLLLSLVGYKRSNTKKNDLDTLLSEFDEAKYLVVKSARIGIGEKVKVLVDGLVISSKGFFVILRSDLRGQIHLNQEDEMIHQVIVRQSYQVKNPIFLALELQKLFHEHMNIDFEYIKPIVVFDQHTELRYDLECTTPTIKVQGLKSYIESQPDGLIPEAILMLIKEQFEPTRKLPH